MKTMSLLLFLVFIPAVSHTFSVIYTHPDYSSSYWRTPSMPTISLTFDQNGDYYTEPISDGIDLDAFRATGLAYNQTDNSVLFTVRQSSDPSFSNPVLIATFDTTPNELAFDASGRLYIIGDPTRGGNEIFQINPAPIPGAV